MWLDNKKYTKFWDIAKLLPSHIYKHTSLKFNIYNTSGKERKHFLKQKLVRGGKPKQKKSIGKASNAIGYHNYFKMAAHSSGYKWHIGVCNMKAVNARRRVSYCQEKKVVWTGMLRENKIKNSGHHHTLHSKLKD